MEFTALQPLLYARANVSDAFQKGFKTGFQRSAEIAVDTDFLFNRWVKIDLEKLAKQFPISEAYKNDLENVKSIYQLTPQEQTVIKQALTDHVFIQAVEVVGDEQVHDVQTTKYRLAFDEKEFTEFAVAILPVVDRMATAAGETAPTAEELRSQLDAAFASSDWKTDLQKDVTIEAYAWISPVDRHVHRVSFFLTPKQEDDRKELESMELTVDFSKHNQPMTITAPTESVSFESMIGEMVIEFGGAGWQQQMKNEQLVDDQTSDTTVVEPVQE